MIKPLDPIDPHKLMRSGTNARAEKVKENHSPGKHEPDALHIAVDEMFAKFQLAYHNQFRKAFPNKALLNRAKQYWHEHLRRFSPAQIKRATVELTASNEFMPALADIVNACRKDITLFGLPPVRRAYEEACLAPAPKAEYDWSHEAVYLAGSAAGWSLLASEPESASYPQFEYHYLDLCRQVVEGAELKIKRPVPLPEQTRTELSAAELRKRLRKMRKELGL